MNGDPLAVTWDTADTDEEQTVRARVLDTTGRETTATLTVNVTQPNQPPELSIIGPTQVTLNDSGQRTVSYRLDASDPDGTIEEVQWTEPQLRLLVNSTSVTWDSTDTSGTQTVRAYVEDDDGARTTAEIQVNVTTQDEGCSGGTDCNFSRPDFVIDGNDSITFVVGSDGTYAAPQTAWYRLVDPETGALIDETGYEFQWTIQDEEGNSIASGQWGTDQTINWEQYTDDLTEGGATIAVTYSDPDTGAQFRGDSLGMPC